MARHGCCRPRLRAAGQARDGGEEPGQPDGGGEPGCRGGGTGQHEAPLVRAVARCQAAGELIGNDAERTELHLWAVAHGMVSIELAGPPARVAVDPALAYEESLVFAVWPFLTPG